MVVVWPVYTLVGCLIAIVSFRVLLGLLQLGASFGGAGASARAGGLKLVGAAQLVLALLSLPGLFLRRVWGWVPALGACAAGTLAGLLWATFAPPLGVVIAGGYAVIHGVAALGLLWARPLYRR